MNMIRRAFMILLCISLLLSCTVVFAEELEFEWEISKESLMASLLEADITSIQEAYKAKLLTCTELTEYYLERIEEYNDTYNCFITLCDDALEQAALRDAAMESGFGEGLLFGIPVVVKDNIDYVGWHTTNGHSKQSSQIAESNAQVVEYLLQEGAVIIGKTNMSTDAQDARASKSYAVGETKNAYNSELASGGSSGGSAVATSLNFSVAGLGTDTNSSLRLPSVLNGCVSLRVTWNTLSTEGIIKLNSTRDVPGAITRGVLDQAIMLDVLSGGKTQYAENLNSDVLNGLRIGVLKELSYAINSERSEKNIDDEVAAAFANAIEELKDCGAEVVEVSIPNILSLASNTFATNQSSSKEKMYRVIESAMEEHQVSALIFPSYLNTPMRSGTDSNGKYWNVNSQTYINNTSQFSSCASLPEIAIPIGYHSLGAGIGMEIAALKNQEQLLLDIAYAYTEKFDHRQAPENAADLYTEQYTGTLGEVVNSYYLAIEEYEEALRLAEEARLAAEEAARLEEESIAASIAASEASVAETIVPQHNVNDYYRETLLVILILAVLVLALLVCIIILSVRVHREKNKHRKAKKGQYSR